jgi:hypothetical protein
MLAGIAIGFCAALILIGLAWLYWIEKQSAGSLYRGGVGMAATIEDHAVEEMEEAILAGKDREARLHDEREVWLRDKGGR